MIFILMIWLLARVDTLQEALIIKAETSQLHLKGHFKLRKCVSNSLLFQDNQPFDSEKEFVLTHDKECETRTLGLV